MQMLVNTLKVKINIISSTKLRFSTSKTPGKVVSPTTDYYKKMLENTKLVKKTTSDGSTIFTYDQTPPNPPYLYIMSNAEIQDPTNTQDKIVKKPIFLPISGMAMSFTITVNKDNTSAKLAFKTSESESTANVTTIMTDNFITSTLYTISKEVKTGSSASINYATFNSFYNAYTDPKNFPAIEAAVMKQLGINEGTPTTTVTPTTPSNKVTLNPLPGTTHQLEVSGYELSLTNATGLFTDKTGMSVAIPA